MIKCIKIPMKKMHTLNLMMNILNYDGVSVFACNKRNNIELL